MTAVPEVLQPGVDQTLSRLAEAGHALADHELLPRILAASPMIGRWVQRHPDEFAGALAGGRLAQAFTASDEPPPEPGGADFDDDLRRYRNAVMVRIAWRQFAGLASPQDTVTELSALADACIRAAVVHHRQGLATRFGSPRTAGGEPVELIVLALGKLGGGELNFSSDVDLVFAITDNGTTDGARELDAQQFYTRLIQRVIATLQDRTEHGFVFRVDLRLRPFGEQGAVAPTVAAMESYYEAHGREWERYAFIKARVVAGDRRAGADLLETLRPFVYRRYLDYGALDSMRDMKAQIDEQVRQRGSELNIKLGWGGIREVEFIAQVFQLIRGGAEPLLQGPRLMEALDAIAQLRLLPAPTVERLREAYWFMRRVENCWQAQNDQQSHELPSQEAPRLALALGLGFDSWGAFEAQLQIHRAYIHARFSELFAQADIDEAMGAALMRWWQEDDADWPDALDPAWRPRFEQLRRAAGRRLGQGEGQQRFVTLLATFVPVLEAARHLERVLDVLEVLAGRGNYVALLLESPVARRELVHLCDSSPRVAEELRRYPALLGELVDPVRLYAPDEREELRTRLQDNLAAIDAGDVEGQLDVLRRVRHATMLRIAAADVAAALPIMRVSDRLSELAEEVVAAALEVALIQMRQRYPELGTPAFAVIAYGKLGGLELSYTSDLDLVFVYRPDPVPGVSLDAPVFYTRLAQKLIHCLATPTGAGMAYEIDTRLRPSGASGLLVTSVDALAAYQRERAWTWEHQALIRARPVAGDAELSAAFNALRQEVLARPRDRAALLADVRDMRQKMRDELTPRDGRFHPKHSPGGIVDIEFLAQFAVLAHAHSHPAVARYTDVLRILETLQANGLLEADEEGLLAETYRRLRTALHARYLGLAEVPDELVEAAAALAPRIEIIQQRLAEQD